ncbi:MAG: general secretion pathway protein GspK [Candidatus Thiodiazotropha sp. (ex Ctena orbiculata)]|nr:general secretion pathway protein GspK [Candidatus Thiodiazotropha taylori]MBT2998140.1 general secretion pathway protein GspK [Candidatus Thiodiazotropha taylori]MBT3002439.1 general secretion pathway protein GspK [Candidatus Thiodiazotropha taylori]MBT3026697.1 general secretion pathway protein GspK [Candidatus Thiodiazotropha taylori]MBT3034181.1 general secretion pathway protein GspK [Candidatus Thiodiazotropha taylori]
MRRASGQQGVALVLVLWLVALLTIVAASFATHSKVETRLTTNAIDALRSRLLAESGVNRSIIELMVSDPEQRWRSNGQVQQIKSDQGELRISIRNSSGLLDLNKTTADQLVNLFALIADDFQEQEALAYRLIDWRDGDDLRHLNGAEDPDYRSAGYAFDTAGRNLASIDELAYVMGFDAAKVDRLRPFVTLYSDTGTVDYNYVSDELRSLLKGELEAGDMLSGPPGYSDIDAEDPEMDEGGGDASASVYRVWVEAVSRQGARTQLLVDIDIRSQDDSPYSIRSWHDSL